MIRTADGRSGEVRRRNKGEKGREEEEEKGMRVGKRRKRGQRG